MVEVGYPSVQASVWTVYLVPKTTPAEIVEKLGAAVQEAFDDEIVAAIDQLGFVVENMSPAEARAFLAAEQEKWTVVVKQAGIEPQ